MSLAGSYPQPRIAALATALPDYPLPQDEVVEHARTAFGARFSEFDRLEPVFRNTGIDMRYSVSPIDWFRQEQNWTERTQAYLAGATELFIRAARKVLDGAGVLASEIDTIVTVSSTGIATPSLEARAHEAMGFRSDVRRMPVFGLGCAGGVTGLAIAGQLAAAEPGRRILLVAVEVCTLAFRADELTKSNIVATALFGDGAAAAIVVADEEDGPRVVRSGEHLWPATLDVMGWSVDPVGFGAIFSRSIPSLVEQRMRPAAELFLTAGGEAPEALDGFVFHPGGTKVIDALEQTFALPDGTLDAERSVLRAFGNMSAPTALFVLKRKLEDGLRGMALMSALGPGFTASFVRIDA